MRTSTLTSRSFIAYSSRLCSLAALASLVQAQSSMMNLGSLGLGTSVASGISGDGSVIVGWVEGSAGGAPAALRWDSAGPPTALSLPGLGIPMATAVSSDGTTIAGSDGYYGPGFRWKAGSITPLWGYPLAVSTDGNIISGYYEFSALLYPYRSVQGAMQDISSILPTIGGASRDGKIVVGSSSPNAVRYDFSTGVTTNLGTLSGNFAAYARDVSDNGSVVVGYAYLPGTTQNPFHAFRWTAAGGMQDLGTLGGNTSTAYATNADGSVVVGEALDASGRTRAFRWTAATGMVDIGTLGGASSRALDITPDGSLIVGSAQISGGVWRAFVYGADCDADSVPDVYALHANPSLDCNANGVLDSCDIAAGTSLDVNMDGRPDECNCSTGQPTSVYCTAKINSQYCTPSIDFSAAPSASGTGHCLITATNILTNRNGLLFYGYQTQAAAYQGGTLCVKGPLHRTPAQNSGGAGSSNPCAGTFTFDFNAYIASGADPLLQVVGQSFACQYWSRDAADPYGSSLTDAVQGQICQ